MTKKGLLKKDLKAKKKFRVEALDGFTIYQYTIGISVAKNRIYGFKI